jgi:hypothetical protein
MQNATHANANPGSNMNLATGFGMQHHTWRKRHQWIELYIADHADLRMMEGG